jgi:hypothetical protein
MPEATTIPATGEYLALGLGAIGTILLIFLASLMVRFRNLRRDEATLEEIVRD